MACAPDRIVSSSYLMLIIGCGPWPRGSCPAPPPSRLRRNIRVPSRDPLLRLRPLCLSPGPRAPAAKRDGAHVDSCGLVEAQPRRALLWAAAPPPGSAVRRAVDGAGWLGDGEPGLGSRREP